MKWAFIDYENVGNLDCIDLSSYEKVVLFLGAKQPKINFGTSRYNQPIDMLLVQLKACQANNLDFHLAYYLGKFNEQLEKRISFDVISNDNGFAPLIAHIKNNGRQCIQVKTQKAAPTQTNDKLLNSLLNKAKEKRPKSVTSLKNHIASHLRLQGNDIAIQQQLKLLQEKKIIAIDNEKINYP